MESPIFCKRPNPQPSPSPSCPSIVKEWNQSGSGSKRNWGIVSNHFQLAETVCGNRRSGTPQSQRSTSSFERGASSTHSSASSPISQNHHSSIVCPCPSRGIPWSHGGLFTIGPFAKSRSSEKKIKKIIILL